MKINTYFAYKFDHAVYYTAACELLELEYSMSRNVMPDGEVEYRIMVYLQEREEETV